MIPLENQAVLFCLLNVPCVIIRVVTACTVSVCVIIHYYCYEYYGDLIGSFACAFVTKYRL